MSPPVLEPVADLAEFREEWVELGAASGNPFASWEFLEAWWRHFGEAGSLAARAVRSGEGRLVAILPLYWWRRRPLSVLRFLGHGPGDRLGPICAAEDREQALQGLYLALIELQPDVLLGEQLAGEERWCGLLAARSLSREGSPVLRFADRSWEELLASWSSNFREQVRRKERKLERTRGLVLRTGVDATLAADLDLLFRLHRARWRGGSSFEAAEPFHREFALRAHERGWLRLRFLELDGSPAAAWYGLHFGSAQWYYQLGRDPVLDRESVGLVLLSDSIRAALREGAREYRFGRGGEAYKYRFASEDPGLETIGLGRSARGALALAAAAGARSLRRGASRSK